MVGRPIHPRCIAICFKGIYGKDRYSPAQTMICPVDGFLKIYGDSKNIEDKVRDINALLSTKHLK